LKSAEQFETDPNLGPLVLEQKATHAIALFLTGTGVLLFLFGILLFFFTRPGQNIVVIRAMIVGSILIVCSLPCCILGLARLWRDRGFALELHTRGIRERRVSGDSVVYFREARELTFQATRIFVHGTCAGTVEHLAVRTGGPEPKALYFQRKKQEPENRMGPGEPSAVDRIAMTIARAIAERLSSRLDKGETLPWTRRMRISLHGLEIEPQRWWERDLRDMARSLAGWFRWAEGSRGGWPSVTWDHIDRMTIEAGVFRLWANGEPRPRLQILTGLPNFHPGYLVAINLLEAARARMSDDRRLP
jgi:hypothetical protein